MINTVQTLYKNGEILLSDEIEIPDNSTIFISFVDCNKDDLFLKASESALDNLWNNNDDDIYEQLLKI